jgi:hypothetical protein
MPRNPPGRRVGTPAAVVLAVLCVLAAPALAQPVTGPPRVMALGVFVGEPSGVSLRMINPDHPRDAWEIGLGWSVAGTDALDFHAQHQWHLVELSNTPERLVTFYLGAGGRVKNADGTVFSLRGALGVNYMHPKKARRWEMFFELAPILDVTPDTDVWLNAMVGMRWFLPEPRR